MTKKRDARRSRRAMLVRNGDDAKQRAFIAKNGVVEYTVHGTADMRLCGGRLRNATPGAAIYNILGGSGEFRVNVCGPDKERVERAYVAACDAVRAERRLKR